MLYTKYMIVVYSEVRKEDMIGHDRGEVYLRL